MKTFIAVVEAGSFTTAADRLGMSKKLTSKYIAELEQRLGTRLLNRTTRSLSVTEAGRVYFQGSRELLESISELEANLNVTQKELRGRLRIAVPVDFGLSCLVPMIADFSEANPQIEIDMQMSDRFHDIVAEGFDLAIRVGVHADSSLVSRLVAKADIWLIAAPSLFDKTEIPKLPEELAPYPCLQDTNFRSGGVWRFWKGTDESRLVPSTRLNANSAQAIKELAVRGHGIARCPGLLAATDVAEGRLLRLLPEYHIQRGEVRIIFSSAQHMSEKVKRFTDFIVDRFKTLPGA